MTDEHRNAIILSATERWKNGRFKRTTKELSQFDNKKPEELSLFGPGGAVFRNPLSFFAITLRAFERTL